MSAKPWACKDCQFAEPDEGTHRDPGDAGGEAGPALYECRRYAPRPIFADDLDPDAITFWPAVLFRQWCGEFQRKDAP